MMRYIENENIIYLTVASIHIEENNKSKIKRTHTRREIKNINSHHYMKTLKSHHSIPP